jgi:hypothetical protein
MNVLTHGVWVLGAGPMARKSVGARPIPYPLSPIRF